MSRHLHVVLFLALTAFAGCTDRKARRYDGAGVVPYERLPRGYRVVSGTRIVLEISEYKSLPLPDAISGFTLLLQTDSAHLRPGAVIELPDSGVASFLAVLQAPSGDTTTNLAGTVRVVRVADRVLEAEFQVSAPQLAWAYTGRARLRTTPATCFDRANWYVRLKGRTGCTEA